MFSIIYSLARDECIDPSLRLYSNCNSNSSPLDSTPPAYLQHAVIRSELCHPSDLPAEAQLLNFSPTPHLHVRSPEKLWFQGGIVSGWAHSWQLANLLPTRTVAILSPRSLGSNTQNHGSSKVYTNWK